MGLLAAKSARTCALKGSITQGVSYRVQARVRGVRLDASNPWKGQMAAQHVKRERILRSSTARSAIHVMHTPLLMLCGTKT
jgi:hypothetical protein